MAEKKAAEPKAASGKAVIIENDEGVSYSVPESAFLDTYEPLGFKVLRYEDGSEYPAKGE